MSADLTLTDIAVRQGWNAGTQLDLTLRYIDMLGSPERPPSFEEFLRGIAAEENEGSDFAEPTVPLPDFQKDVEGQCYGGAFWSEAEYRIRIVLITPGDRYLLTVELGDGSKVGEMTISDEEVEGLQRVASTDHGLGAFDDDWKIPSGMDRTIEWTLQTDINHTVRLDATGIDEIAAWFRFATGEEVWDGGEDWEY